MTITDDGRFVARMPLYPAFLALFAWAGTGGVLFARLAQVFLGAATAWLAARLAGEAFGRWPNGSGGLYPMVSATPGAANSGPRIGPVIITEAMYKPAGANDDLEYVEVQNVTDAGLDVSGWKFDKEHLSVKGEVVIKW